MILLALSTSTPLGSVALLRGAEVLASRRYEGGTGHAELLFDAIDATMAEAGLERPELEAVACDVGPGSFTGVRVSVAAAKGIALALGIPTAAVLSLDAMLDAHARAGSGAPAVAAIDAKKGELFVSAREAGAGGSLLDPRHLPPDEVAACVAALDAQLGRAVTLVGEVFAEVEALAHRASPRGPGALPDAVDVGLLAARIAHYVPPDDLDPVYVRAPDISTPRV